MITPVTFYQADCDECGKQLEDSITMGCAWSSEQELIELANEEGWSVTGVTCLCDACSILKNI